MARRSDHSREQLYELALTTAADIVETDGFRALTARNVADAIGYSPGTLYNIFANLDDLILHLNGRTLDRIHDLFVREQLTGDVHKDIDGLLRVYLHHHQTHRSQWELLTETERTGDQLLPQWYITKIERVLGIVETALAPIYGGKKPKKRHEAARVLWAGLHGICALAASGKLMVTTDKSMEAMARSLVTHYLAGLIAVETQKKTKTPRKNQRIGPSK